MNPETIVPIILKVSALLAIFAIGLSANLQDATYLFRNPRELARAVFSINVVMPVLVVGLAFLFDLHPAVRIALIGLSLSPVPPVMPPKLSKAGGTQSYAYGLVVGVGVVSILVVPLAMVILGAVLDLPLAVSPLRVALVISLTILLPIGLGVAIHTFAPALAARVAPKLMKVASLVLIVSLLWLLFLVRRDIWSLVGGGLFLAFIAFVVLGLAVGHFLGGKGHEDRAALAISTAARHPGIALTIAQINFPNEPLVVVALLLFIPLSAVVTIPYFAWAKRQVSAAEPHSKA